MRRRHNAQHTNQWHARLRDVYCCVIIWETNMHTWSNALTNPRCHEWKREDEREGKEGEVYCETVRNLGVRRQWSCRPPPDRQQSVMGVIDEGGCISPQSASAFREPRDIETGAKVATYLSHPFTAVIECLILPVKLRYLCGIDNFLWCCGAKRRRKE